MTRQWKGSLTCLFIFSLVSCVYSYRILGIFPLNAKSHFIVFESVMKGLAKHGHQVDVISHFPQKNPMKNYHDIVSLEGTMESLINNFTLDFIIETNDDDTRFIAEQYGNRLCHFMGLERMQQVIKNPPMDPPYDLVITEVYASILFSNPVVQCVLTFSLFNHFFFSRLLVLIVTWDLDSFSKYLL